MTPLPHSALSRRRLLKIGGIGALAGLNLPGVLRAEHLAAPVKPRVDHCVLLFLNGGPSHLDMWDMKPDAPDGIRGEFKPIATSVPGLQLCEHMPKLAKLAHHSAIVRSVNHQVNVSHATAVYTAMTGHDRKAFAKGGTFSVEDYPTFGSVLGKLRPPERVVVPAVHLPYETKEGAGGPPQPGFYGGFLGRAYDPLFVTRDPNAADFSVPELTLAADVSLERLEARRSLFNTIDAQLAGERGRAALAAMDGYQKRALELITSKATQEAFDLSRESAEVRDAYGRNIYGQSVLLARRLVEAGTRLVTLSWAPDANATWDTHGSNFKSLKERLLPQFDAATSSLVSELESRNLLDRTLVVAMGDFGRTPKINGANGGRDHWASCYSVQFFGGGIKGGAIHGSSDKIGAYPASDPVDVGDVIATVYRLLGFDPDSLIHDMLGRPHRLIHQGNPIQSILA